jgi:putative ABC transport system permease protein
MIRNFLKTTWRNLMKRKGYMLLNIAGLALGMACCLLIFEYVAYERSYDNFYPHGDRIFRVQDEQYQTGRLVVPCAAAMPGVAPAMMREIPEVENACRLHKVELLLGNENRGTRFREPASFHADETVLDLFSISLVEGDPKVALEGPGKVVLSAKEAQKYFGREDPLGKRLTVYSSRGVRQLEVTGIFRDRPSNTHIRMDILVSYKTYSQVLGTYGKPNDILETSFSWTDFYTYIKIRPGTSEKQVALKMPAFIDRHFNDLPDNKAAGNRYSLSLMPIDKIHLYSNYTEEADANGDAQSVSFLLMIAILIICIAWINYINLATARSLERAKEVGMRKVLGATRKELVRQFMMESFLLNMIALFAGAAIAIALNPFFAGFSGRPLSPLFSMDARYWVVFFGLFVAGTSLSGLYPALVISRYQPVTVLKGNFKNSARGLWLRKGLIVGQFIASIGLIAATLVVYRQVSYMRSQALGANMNQTLVMKGATGSLPDSTYQDAFQAFKSQLLEIHGIKSITASSDVMGNEILWSTDWQKIQGGNRKAINLFHLGVDDDFISGYGLKIIAGRPFSPTFGNERKSIIINESAVKALGFSSPPEALGVLISGGQRNMDSMQIVGVIADFHNEGLQKAIQPLVLFPHRDRRAYYSVKLQGENPSAVIAAIKLIWGRYFPDDPFDYYFLDDYFAHQYDEFERFGQVFALFSMLAMGIACFGLLGLSAYNVLQRTKEIGIRKVLGASVRRLLIALSKEFLLLVLLSFLITIPLVKLVMDRWLQGFAYRIGIGWWIYAAAGGIAIAISICTVGFHALKASRANPVTSLRTE